ncbi:MCE family protein [Gordonia jinhuaensis]|uniref:Mammalian cell entry protein n=1 Tax=Gordonia jinhuaensis TaxID=1517702 RepID=A0A916TH84_9ACTN|nr:mammalian cell entry protein [Gordonia jinhuaensis]
MVLAAIVFLCAGCGFNGLNSMTVPGAQGTDRGSYHLTAIIPDAAGLVQNAPVLLDDATVGSVGTMKVDHWKARITVRLNGGTRIPEGSHVMVGMTSVLGSMNLQIVQPAQPNGRYLAAGATIPFTKCPEQRNIQTDPGTPQVPDVNVAQQVSQCTYPSTEQALSSLSVILNGGGLAQAGDIVHELDATLGGREALIAELIPRLNTLVSDLNSQRDNIIDAMTGLDRLSAILADNKTTVANALADGPKILKVLVDQRPQFVAALDALGKLSATTDDILDANSGDIKTITANLVPVLDQLQRSGPSLTNSLDILLTFPFSEKVIPQIVRGDYVNAAINLDLTQGRLQRGVLAEVGGGSTFYGPEGVLGKPAGAAAHGVDPFTAPLDPKQGSGPALQTPGSGTRGVGG